MRELLAIAAGGALGAVARYAVSVALNPRSVTSLPWGTLAVNLGGSILLGLVMGLHASGRLSSPALKALVATGFCGAFTTFSTFSVESVQLLRGGHTSTALLYIALNLGLCLAGATLGILITTR